MKAHVVSLDETQHCAHNADIVNVESVQSVYLYDPEERTHLCEATPSYHLTYLYTYIVCKDGTPDDMQEALHEKYCTEGGDDTYMHCDVVKRLTTKDCGEFEDHEEAREYLVSNCPF